MVLHIRNIELHYIIKLQLFFYSKYHFIIWDFFNILRRILIVLLPFYILFGTNYYGRWSVNKRGYNCVPPGPKRKPESCTDGLFLQWKGAWPLLFLYPGPDFEESVDDGVRHTTPFFSGAHRAVFDACQRLPKSFIKIDCAMKLPDIIST